MTQQITITITQAIRLQLEADREAKEKWINAKPPEAARKIPNLRADLVQAKKQEDAAAQVVDVLFMHIKLVVYMY